VGANSAMPYIFKNLNFPSLFNGITLLLIGFSGNASFIFMKIFYKHLCRRLGKGPPIYFFVPQSVNICFELYTSQQSAPCRTMPFQALLKEDSSLPLNQENWHMRENSKYFG
jgi:hypothetical protein